VTLTEKLNRLPPCLCRLLAKHGGKLMTQRELRQLTGFSNQKLERICKAASWSKINVHDADKFLLACGLVWSRQRKNIWTLKAASAKGLDGLRRMKHLRSANSTVVTMLLKRTEKILRNSN